MLSLYYFLGLYSILLKRVSSKWSYWTVVLWMYISYNQCIPQKIRMSPINAEYASPKSKTHTSRTILEGPSPPNTYGVMHTFACVFLSLTVLLGVLLVLQDETPWSWWLTDVHYTTGEQGTYGALHTGQVQFPYPNHDARHDV